MAEVLNDKQVRVLRWVADGCPDGVMHGDSHKLSAAALRSRGLVRTSGRGPRWRAEITEHGRSWLANPPAPKPARPRAKAPVREAESAGEQGPGNTSSRLKTEQLVAAVIDAGGVLRLSDETAHGGVDYRQRAYAAQRHGKVPAGKHLTVERRDGTFTISLVDGETGNEIG